MRDITNNYIDYDYYSNTYDGDLIPQKEFEKFAKGASYEIKLRIQNKDISNFEEEVKYTACSVADILYNKFLNKEKIKNIINGSEKVITSEKVGDYSRNIQSISNSDLMSLASEEKVQNEISLEIEKKLYFTGLLYGGIGCVR